MANNFEVAQGLIAPGAYTLIEEQTIGSAVTTFDFSTTLDGDNDGGYAMELLIKQSTGSTSTYTIRINGADWAGTRAAISAVDTSLTSARSTTMTFNVTPTGGTSEALVLIPFSATGNKRGAFTNALRDLGTSLIVEQRFFDITTPSTSTNITSLGVSTSVSSAIGVGCIFRLYKLK